MTLLADNFKEYEPEIFKVFKNIAEQCGCEAKLELVNTKSGLLFRAIPSQKAVKIEWRGIASLWAMSQSVGRLAYLMFEARRRNEQRLELTEGAPATKGYELLLYSSWLAVPQTGWNTYYDRPSLDTGEDNAKGNRLFFMALEWIVAHEISHISLGHQDQAWSDDESRQQETEADSAATRLLKGNLFADFERELGSPPSEGELELERRALAVGLGLAWVAVYEDIDPKENVAYPSIANRLFREFQQLNLREDSFVGEVLADLLKAWIDPQGDWTTFTDRRATAEHALNEAFGRVEAYARERRLKLK